MALALGVLISGRGSNLVAILDAIQQGTLDANVKIVVSNKANAAGLELAKERGIQTVFLDPKPFAQNSNSRETYDLAVGTMLQEHGVECVVLAGFMRIVTPALIRMFFPASRLPRVGCPTSGFRVGRQSQWVFSPFCDRRCR